MRMGGAAVAVVVLVVVASVAIGIRMHTTALEEARTTAVAQFSRIDPQCQYEDKSLCPQVDAGSVIPNRTGILLVLLGILLAAYLFRSDQHTRQILGELKERRHKLSQDERRTLILSILTKDERTIIEAVEHQPGISQATLALRSDMSPAKLSGILKELEARGIVARAAGTRANEVHLKRAW